MRLVDADALKPALLEQHDHYKYRHDDFAVGKCAGIVDAMELVDVLPAVPVVRCRDCKYWFGDDDDMYHSCELDALLRPAGWYCAGGERRENE